MTTSLLLFLLAILVFQPSAISSQKQHILSVTNHFALHILLVFAIFLFTFVHLVDLDIWHKALGRQNKSS